MSTTIEVGIIKADAIGTESVCDGIIHITKELPEVDIETSLKEIEAMYEYEANKIYNVLKKTLPQATMHQLLILMLKGKQCLYIGNSEGK